MDRAIAMATVERMDVGPAELIIVLVIALVLFGGKKLPELARSLGQARNEFEKGSRGEVDDAPSERAGAAVPAVESSVGEPPVGEASSIGGSTPVGNPPQD